jgi:hypothetical protein
MNTTAATALRAVTTNRDWTDGWVTLPGALRATLTGKRSPIQITGPGADIQRVIDTAVAAVANQLGVDPAEIHKMGPEEITEAFLISAAEKLEG